MARKNAKDGYFGGLERGLSLRRELQGAGMADTYEGRVSFDLENLTVAELLSTYNAILDELRRREIVRSSNNPLSDYAELLFCRAFQWVREGNSKAGHDATDAAGLRYQIKGRRLTRHNPSRQMSAIRGLDASPFDYLGGVIVDEDFKIVRAALVPVAVVRERSDHVAHTNSWRFLLRDDVWTLPGVRDVTAELQATAVNI